ncbi:AMIN-like domain-containing (lipo)protein [Cellulomonas sp. ICMP 17802]|uniref:AMIN-like domain-containing (lipo)protein n=1 Tax=Cellulomonas sp. ICMP 17802 TaxID=3239199 RepID=UPI00351BCF7F
MSARRAAVLAVATILLLGSCGSPAPDEPAPTTSAPTTSPAPSPSATSAEPDAPVPFPADVAADEQPASAGAALTVTDVTTGEHDGYDRVVFRFDGTGTPGWMVRYVDVATDDPADTVLDIAGDGTLQVTLLGIGLPADTGIPEWSGTNPILTPDYPVLREVAVRGQFEGQELAFVGVDTAGHPFRVFALTDPVRVVLDVRHDS